MEGRGRTESVRRHSPAGCPSFGSRHRSRPIASLALGLALFSLLTAAGQPAEGHGPSAAPSSGEPGQQVLSIGLAPVKAALDLRAGQETSLTAIFCTGSGQKLHAAVDVRDGLRRGSEGFEFAPPGQEYWSAGRWLTVEPAEFDIGPNERRDLLVTVKVPEGIPDGEYYAGFFVRAAPATGSGSGVSLQVAGSVGSVVCIAVGDHLARSARLVTYGDVPRTPSSSPSLWSRAASAVRHWWRCLVIDDRNVAWLTEGQPLVVFLPLENTGATHIQPRVTLTFSRGGRVLQSVAGDGEMVLPGDARVIEVTWLDAPLYGRLRMKLEIEYGGSEPIVATHDFVILPVKGILGLAALAFGLGYFAARGGRRRAQPAPPPAKPPAEG